jgi:class 3 adenylate cyclase/tetratricopeptide (TPR) repeat protein
LTYTVCLHYAERMDAAAWHDAVAEAERSGELFTAFDIAERGLEEHPSDRWLQHRAVLALARSGAPEAAQQRFADYGLHAEATHDEDVAALEARIAKDLALGGRVSASAAAALYEAIYARTGGYYTGINAATLRLLSGDEAAARRLATTVLGQIPDDGSYYAAATEGEAHLVLGNEPAAAAALRRAADVNAGDYAALATTRQQLQLVCDQLGIDRAMLAPLRGPTVLHFCGHRIAPAGTHGRLDDEDAPLVAEQIRQVVIERRVGYGYGALASGGDILCAEALLDAGAQLCVVLPYDRDEFVRESVAPAGGDWVARFEACLAAAARVVFATEDAYLDDDVLYRHSTELAMGLALLHARHLGSDAIQLAIWDGQPAEGEAGTAIDVARWQASGQSTLAIAPPDRGPRPAPAPATTAEPFGRIVRAMLFADIRGFSKLSDQQLRPFTEHVLGALAAVLDQYGDAVSHRNTWGDGLYVVMREPETAAGCALDLQDAITRIPMEAHGLPAELALRLGAHVGPVVPIQDPILGSMGFGGSHVSRTARIEPVTPPGAVYVTEAFAAALELAARRDFTCAYAGQVPAAKDYGRLRMYRLQRRGA